MKLFTIFGNPVSHSRSPLMHNSVFKHLDFPACYIRTELQKGSLLREKFFTLKLSGANITVPHKEAAFTACDEIRGFAKKVGVVNTIVKEGDRLIGYNTDADGFLYAIKEFKNINRVLILGAGGTAKALALKFLEEKMQVSVLNRSNGRLDFFQTKNIETATWDTFHLLNYDLVVNTTSAGLKDETLPVPKEMLDAIFKKTNYCADVIYGKETPFLKMAKSAKIPCKDGSDMLLGQGVLANELFTEHRYNKEDIKRYMQQSFEL